MRRGTHVLLALLGAVPACFSDNNRVLTTGTATTAEDASTTGPTSGGSDGSTTSGTTTGEASSSGTTEPPQELIVGVVDSDNDALQDPDGSVKVAFGWTTLNSSNHWGGLRFAVPDVPQGATIVGAELMVFCDAEETDSPRVEIYGELGPNPGVFTTTTNDISARPRTLASVFWTGDDVGMIWTKSPSLVSVIQELVDQEDWAPNQHMVLILDATAEASGTTPFEYRQWDFDAFYAPKLGILYYAP